MYKWQEIILVGFTLLLSLLLDGAITFMFYEQLLIEDGIMVPRLFFIVLIIFSFYLPINELNIYAIFFGLLYDSYYTGILGIYIAGSLIIVNIAHNLKKYAHSNILEMGLIAMILIAILEVIVHLVYTAVGIAEVPFVEFIVSRVGPTIILNGVFFLLLYYPVSQLSKKILETS